MIGDVSDFMAIIKKKVCFLLFCNIGGVNDLFFRKRWKFLRLKFIIGGKKEGDDDGGDLDDDAQVYSCHVRCSFFFFSLSEY